MSSRPSNVPEEEELDSLVIIAIVVGSTGLILMVLGGVYYLSRRGDGPRKVGVSVDEEEELDEEDPKPKKKKEKAEKAAASESEAEDDEEEEQQQAEKKAVVVTPVSAMGSPEDDDEESQVTIKEEMIEVFAPPGKLGVILDTVRPGPPVIHEIRKNSVLENEVKLGDRLISVDEVDVREMTASKVSKLISQKVDQPTRKLTIIRAVSPSEVIMDESEA